MPTYCYSNKKGLTEEHYFKVGEAPKTVILEDGSTGERDYHAEHSPQKAGGGWPLECVASGVAPHQAGELREFFKKHGFRCDVSKDGNPIYENARHRKAALKLRNLHDQSSFC